MSATLTASPRARVSVVTVAAGLASAGFMAMAVGAAWSAVHVSPRFVLERIEIEGAVRLTDDEVREIANVRTGRPLAEIDPDLVAARLERAGWIARARVTRHWPDRLHVVIEECEPRALMLADGVPSMDGLYAVDANGFVFKRAEAADRFDLPVVTGIPLSSGPEAASARLSLAVSLLDTLAEHAPQLVVDEIHQDRVGRWSIVTDEAREIVLGPAAEIRPALERYAQLRGSIETAGAPVLRVDVSDPVNAYVRFAATTAPDVKG